MIRLWLLAVLVLAGPVPCDVAGRNLMARLRADPPALTLPAQITGLPGSFITVQATTPAKNVRWVVMDEGLNLFPAELLKDTHTAVVSTSVPGTYRLLAVTAAGDEVSTPAVCRVVIQGPAPAPTPAPTPPAPSPGPAPPPAPAPAVKAAWAIVVIDNTARTPALAALLTSPTLAAALKARGVSWRVLDVNDPYVASKGYAKWVTAAGGAPALVLLTAEGDVIKSVKLPVDETSVLALIPNAAAPTAPAPVCGPNGCPFCPR